MLEAVIKAITPKIMTWSQYAEAAWFMYQKKVMKNPAYKRYMPDYTKCMEHFALHAGGYAVLKGIQKGMNLPDEAVIPSFASLRDMGNTSSSTTWYTIAYLESQSMVKKGQQIMQVRARCWSGAVQEVPCLWRQAHSCMPPGCLDAAAQRHLSASWSCTHVSVLISAAAQGVPAVVFLWCLAQQPLLHIACVLRLIIAVFTCCNPQVGAGGGMKGGVNIWKALKDNDYVHPCWLHCAGRPYRCVLAGPKTPRLLTACMCACVPHVHLDPLAASPARGLPALLVPALAAALRTVSRQAGSSVCGLEG